MLIAVNTNCTVAAEGLDGLMCQDAESLTDLTMLLMRPCRPVRTVVPVAVLSSPLADREVGLTSRIATMMRAYLSQSCCMHIMMIKSVDKVELRGHLHNNC